MKHKIKRIGPPITKEEIMKKRKTSINNRIFIEENKLSEQLTSGESDLDFYGYYESKTLHKIQQCSNKIKTLKNELRDE